MRLASKLILIGSGTAALALAFAKRRRIAEVASDVVTEVVEHDVVAVAYTLRDKLPWSNKPSATLIDAIGKANAKYPKVPVLILLAVCRNESNFRIGTCDNPFKAGTFRREPGSYKKLVSTGRIIPGTGKKWADVYTAEEWGSYGPFQLLPYNFVPSLVSAGEPLCKGHDPYISAMGAAKLLSDAYSKHGNWVNALAEYNGGAGGAKSSKIINGYVKHVAKHLTDLGPEARALLPETIAGLAGLDGERREDSYPVYDGFGRIVDWVDVLSGDVCCGERYFEGCVDC